MLRLRRSAMSTNRWLAAKELSATTMKTMICLLKKFLPNEFASKMKSKCLVKKKMIFLTTQNQLIIIKRSLNRLLKAIQTNLKKPRT